LSMRNSLRQWTDSMTSERKIAANRKNAKKSTGPRSAAGRATSRHNARRHGLATGIGSDPALRDDIEILAKLLAGGRENIGEFAREAAEAHLDLARIRRIRAGLFARMRFFDAASTEDLMALAEQFARLERYERRAFSRRKRALRLI
jgi:hypothetical protein